MSAARRLFRRLLSDDAGVIAPMAILLLGVMLAFSALVLDVGVMYAHRRSLQNAADAAALAGARQLQLGILGVTTTPEQDAAQAAAAFAARNGVGVPDAACASSSRATLVANQAGPAELGFAPSGFAPSDGGVVPRSWQVETSRLVRLHFGPILGMPTQCVRAHAIAVVTEARATKLFPWGLLRGCPTSDPNCTRTQPSEGSFEDLIRDPSVGYGTEVVLKQGAHGSSSGNFGIVDFTCDTSKGGGTSEYVPLMYTGYGSNGEYIPPLPWEVCTETGNKASPNKAYADYVRQQLLEGCADDSGRSIKCPLVGLVPIIEGSSWPSGGKPILLVQYAAFQITDVPAASTGQMEIWGMFLQVASGVGGGHVPDPNGELTGLIGVRLWQP